MSFHPGEFLPDLTAADFAGLIAQRISAEHVALSGRWLERLVDLLPVNANDVFPTEHLLDHIPALIREVAAYVRAPEAEAVGANTAIITKAQELGELRHTQQASVHQLLAEYRLLGGILTTFVQEELARADVSPSAADAVEVMRRLNDAIWILTQTTVNTFVAEYTGTIASHAARLESFNRMVSHELRQPLGTLMYALPLMRADVAGGDAARCEHFLAVMERNVVRLVQQMEQLEALSRLQARQPDAPDLQRVEVSAVAWEVARQLREMADTRGVDVHVSEVLPVIVIDTARLELILMNLVSNAIKYSDPDKPQRVVHVEAASPANEDVVCIVVRDNGLGIPESSLTTVFRRFVRVHSDRDAELKVRGSGLGLAIAAECVEAVGGAIRVESRVGVGTSFFVSIPRQPSHPVQADTRPATAE
jgi:signal transduction histidine kinase